MEGFDHGVGGSDRFVRTVPIDYNVSAFITRYCQLLAQGLDEGDEVLGVRAIANVEEGTAFDALSDSANNSQTCSSIWLLRLGQSNSRRRPKIARARPRMTLRLVDEDERFRPELEADQLQ